jgi:biofilm protein TabA
VILDKIENGGKYACLSSRFAKAFEILQSGELEGKEEGKYEVEGAELYYMVQRYVTKPAEERRFESHRRYADIQAVLSGKEVMGYIQSDGLEVTAAYDDTKDIMFFDTPASFTNLEMASGEFVVLFPDEGHMPQVQLGGPAQVLKIVFKVLVD